MNCTTVRGRLLGCEQPSQPPPELHLHLARCPACRAWQRRLVRAEQQVVRLPVPPSAGPARVVAQILRAPPPAPRPAPRPLVRPNPVSPGLAPRERGQQKLALALALAAALATFALGWWAWPHGLGEHPDAFAARRQQLDQRVLAARTPQERVRIVADELDRLQREIRGHVDDVPGLEGYANYYEVVQKRLLVEARALPPGERPALWEIAGRLRRAESEASRLAAEATEVSDGPLHRIATAAAEGNRRLRALADEAPDRQAVRPLEKRASLPAGRGPTPGNRQSICQCLDPSLPLRLIASTIPEDAIDEHGCQFQCRPGHAAPFGPRTGPGRTAGLPGARAVDHGDEPPLPRV